MLKSLGVLIGGVFVGAVGVEVVNRKYPEAVNKMQEKVRQLTSEAKKAFKNGYKSATVQKTAAA
jgi:hypothetical protein